MEKKSIDKIERVLSIYTKLINGAVVSKSEEANRFGVNERSIQRDIDDIRNFLENDGVQNGSINTIIYDRTEKGYRLEKMYQSKFTNGEMLAICKILLDSRALIKEEMSEILSKLISCCVQGKNRQMISALIRNEEYHYVQPRHKTKFLDRMWEIGQAIRKYQYIEIDYERTKDHSIVKRKLKPVAIMFSEFYFYLTAYIENEKVRQDFDNLNDSFPTIYRIDRIKKLKVLDEKFHVLYSNRFEEGQFRKKIQFMYGGKLQNIKFRYLGNDIDAVLDRLPTANVISEENGEYLVSAEVFGKGIDMWLRSQGDNVQLCNKEELQ